MSAFPYHTLSFLTAGQRNLISGAKLRDETNEDIPPRLLVLVGVTGSGKSTMAMQLVNYGFTIIGSVHRGEVVTKMEMLRSAIRLLCDGKSVIVDLPNLTELQRNDWVSLGKARGCEVELVVFYFPRKVCLERCVQFVSEKKKRAEIEHKLDKQIETFEPLGNEQHRISWYVGTLYEFERLVSFCSEKKCYTRQIYRKRQCIPALSSEGCYHLFCPFTISGFITTPYFNTVRQAEISRIFCEWKEVMQEIDVVARHESLAKHIRSALQSGNFDITINYMRVLAETLGAEDCEPHMKTLEQIRNSFHAPHHRRQLENPQIFTYREVRKHVDTMEQILCYMVPNFGRKLRANRRSRCK